VESPAFRFVLAGQGHHQKDNPCQGCFTISISDIIPESSMFLQPKEAPAKTTITKAAPAKAIFPIKSEPLLSSCQDHPLLTCFPLWALFLQPKEAPAKTTTKATLAQAVLVSTSEPISVPPVLLQPKEAPAKTTTKATPAKASPPPAPRAGSTKRTPGRQEAEPEPKKPRGLAALFGFGKPKEEEPAG
jgi:hypothetical protein